MNVENMTVNELKAEVDKLSEKWNDAQNQGNLVLRDEIGDTIHFYLTRIEEQTGEWYRPKHSIENL